MISTDKAVNPTSIMGCSKRVAEMYIQDLSRTAARSSSPSASATCLTQRFGHPIFKRQIAEGGPVTVTASGHERYFMTDPEASQLVLQAATMAKAARSSSSTWATL